MEILLYFFQVNISLTILYMVYVVFLKNVTFYNLNRYYFLISIAFSFLFPLIDWSKLWKNNSTLVQPVIKEHQLEKISTLSYIDLLPYVIYFLAFVMILLGLKLVIRFLSIFYIHLNSKSSAWKNIPYRHVFRKISPFSFWKSIYVHPEKHPENEFISILLHEQIHVKQRHTFDVIIMEFVCILNWFNPFVWKLKNAVHQNLEYLTDTLVLKNGVDKKSYQLSLIRVQQELPVYSLGNSFSIGMLKSRIKMMNRKKSSFLHLYKYVLSVPFAMLIAITFTVGKVAQNDEFEVILESIHNSFKKPQETPDSFTKELPLIKIGSLPTPVDPVLEPFETDFSVLIEEEELKSIYKPYTEPYMPSQEEIKVLNSAKSSDDLKVARVVRGYKVSPVEGENQNKAVALSTAGKEIVIRGNPSSIPSDDLVILYDGKRIEDLESISPESIESISVFKGSSGKAKQYIQEDKDLIVIVSKNSKL